MFDYALLQNLERKPLLQLHSCGAENGSNRSCRSALLADNFAEVGLSHSQLKNSCLFAFNWLNRYLIGIVHQSFRDLFDQLLHSYPQTQRCASAARINYK